MKIIIEKETNTVLYYLNDNDHIVLLKNKMIGDVKAFDVGSDTHLLIENVEPVDIFVPSCMTYENGKWKVCNDGHFSDQSDKGLEICKNKKNREIIELQERMSDSGIIFEDAMLSSSQETIDIINNALDRLTRIKEKTIKINCSGRSLEVNAIKAISIKEAIIDHRLACHEAGYNLATSTDGALTVKAIDDLNIYNGWPVYSFSDDPE